MSKSSSKNKSNKQNIIIIVLVIAIIACSIFFGVQFWENKQSEPQSPDINQVIDSALEYDGKKYDLKENVETILVIGLDKHEKSDIESYNNNMQADFLMLLVIDNDARKCSAVHINRDSIVEMSVLGVAGDKVDVISQQIALAHTYGNGKEVSCRNTAEAVSKLLLNIDIDYYMSVTMDAVVTYNDFVGGVEVEVLDDFTGVDDTLVKGKKVTLTGEHALNYVRSRYGLEDSTNTHRMERQRQYLQALYSKTSDCLNNDENFIVEAASRLSAYVVSNCSGNKLQNLAEKISAYELVEICTIDGESVKGENHMEFYPDAKSVEDTVVKLFYTPRG